MRGLSRRLSTVLLIISVAIGLCSLTVNFFLGNALLRAFAELQLTRVFPIGPPAQKESAVERDLGCISIYGDSRASMWDTGSLQGVCPVKNLGHGGFTSSQLLWQLHTLHRRRNRWSILQIGINDIHPIGALPAYKPLILAELRRNYGAILGLLLDCSDNVVVSTIIPPGHVPWRRRLVWDPDTLGYILDMNQAIRDMAKANRILLLDAAHLLQAGDHFLDSQYMVPDSFLHVNKLGYGVLNDELMHLLTVAPVRKQSEADNCTQ
jgi:lysophospholipase L1-like esterase